MELMVRCKMKIGIIGPKSSTDKIKKTIKKNFPHIVISVYIKEKIADAHEVFSLCQSENDGILFTGIGVLKSVLNSNAEVTKPYDYIPKRESSILQVLWEMKKKKNFPERVSVDVITDFFLEEAIDEFNISFKKSYVLPYSVELSETEYEKFHEELYLKGETDAIITGFGSIYTSLKEKKYPVYWLHPTNMQIRERVEKLIDKIEANLLSAAGIAVQIIKLSNSETSLCQYETIKRKGLFELKLLDYVKEIQGSVFNFGRDEYIIFSTRGATENKENISFFINLIKKSKKYGFDFFSGIGYGMTSYMGENAARKALANSVASQKSSLFIVDGDKIKGPLGEDEQLSYSLKVSDRKILKISKLTGISASYITKIMSLSKKTGKKDFDSKELGNYLGITERSARRILKKFLDNGLGVISGKEAVKGVGRPKNIINLNFLKGKF